MVFIFVEMLWVFGRLILIMKMRVMSRIDRIMFIVGLVR